MRWKRTKKIKDTQKNTELHSANNPRFGERE